MTGPERSCRMVLAAFPPEWRAERGDDLVSTLLDATAPGARRISVRTAANAVASGLRMRASHAGSGRNARGEVAAGVRVTATAAIGLQAAVAVASAVYFLEHGVVFYLNGGQDRATAVGAQHPAAWIAAAVVSVADLAAAAVGRRRLAALGSVVAAGYPVAVAAVLVHHLRTVQLHMIPAAVVGSGAGASAKVIPQLPNHPFSFKYQDLVSTPGVVAIGVVAAAVAVLAAWRSGPAVQATRRYAIGWVAATVALAGVLALVGDGSGASGSWPDLSYSIPPQGGVMTAFQYLWVGGVAVALLWGRFDPRVNWAAAMLSVPFVAYQVSSLTVGASYYGELYQPWWKTDLPLLGAILALALLTSSALQAGRRLRRA